jgi:RNA polymerase sigma factor (sigma-70 family)
MKNLKGYLAEAEGIIVKWGPIGLLYDNECVGYVASKLMEADWKYDPTKGASQTTWRILCGRWAIYNWIRDRKAQQKRTPMSLFSLSADGTEIWEAVEDERANRKPQDENVERYYAFLTERQKEYFIDHFKNGLSITEIGKKRKVSKQAVSDSIKQGVEKIRCCLKKERIKHEAQRKTC